MASLPATPKPPAVHVRAVSSEPDLASALTVRRRVFVDELGIPPAEEFDSFDAWPLPPGVTHFLVTVDRRPIATCRINCAAMRGAKLERMAVDKVARRNGVGLALLRHIEKHRVVEDSRGPFFCYAMKDKELFYRNSGWVVEDGHGAVEDAGIPHVAMIRRRRPRGSPPMDGGTLSHVMVRTWDISRARRFYSLLGYQDVSRFLTNGLRAAWIQKESMERFRTKLRLLEKPREIMLGATITEVAFMTDADGTVIELMRFVKRLEDRVEFDAQW